MRPEITAMTTIADAVEPLRGDDRRRAGSWTLPTTDAELDALATTVSALRAVPTPAGRQLAVTWARGAYKAPAKPRKAPAKDKPKDTPIHAVRA
jgi:hypothetical protein